MKRLGKIVVWVLLSLVAQLSIYLYMDKVRYVEQTAFATKSIQVGKKTDKQIDVSIPETAKNINVSFDGRYVAYFQGGELRVIDSFTGATKKQALKDGNEIEYYKWLPDEARMFIAEKDVKRNQLNFFSYDVKKDDKNQIMKRNEPVNISLPDKKSYVEDIEIGTLTNVIYVKLNHSGKRNSIYRIDINNDLSKIRSNSYMIGNSAAINRDDILLYEDKSNAKQTQIRLTDSSKTLKRNEAKNLCLLSVDQEDIVYLGELEDNKVKRIYSGTLEENIDKWKIVELKESVDKKDIYITNEGKIYYNDNLRGVVIEISTGKETFYSGKFHQMFNGGIASISNGKLLKYNFK